VLKTKWMLRIGQNLMCPEEIAPSDIILAENFEPDYWSSNVLLHFS
jgi:hypothetical protein